MPRTWFCSYKRLLGFAPSFLYGPRGLEGDGVSPSWSFWLEGQLCPKPETAPPPSTAARRIPAARTVLLKDRAFQSALLAISLLLVVTGFSRIEEYPNSRTVSVFVREVKNHLNYEHRVFNSEEFLKTRAPGDQRFYKQVRRAGVHAGRRTRAVTRGPRRSHLLCDTCFQRLLVSFCVSVPESSFQRGSCPSPGCVPEYS